MTILVNPAGGVYTGRKVCTTAGTAEQLASTSEIIVSIAIQAETNNTAEVAVGDSNVVAADDNERGILLAAGESTTISVMDLSDIWIDAKSSGDGVSYLYLKAN